MGEGDTPIFFIPSGTPDTCFQISLSMMDAGFYQSSAAYPSVPYNSSGVRLTITNWLELEDIEKMVVTLHQKRQAILQKEGITEQVLRKNFRGIDFSIAIEHHS